VIIRDASILNIEHFFRGIARCAVAAVIWSGILVHEAFAVLQTIDFYVDDLEKSVSLPEVGCAGFLDDTSGFSFAINENTLAIEAATTTTRGATLLVNCPTSGENIYSLRFVPRKKYSENVSAAIAAPAAPSGVFIHGNAAFTGLYGWGGGLFDQSYDGLQYTYGMARRAFGRNQDRKHYSMISSRLEEGYVGVARWSDVTRAGREEGASFTSTLFGYGLRAAGVKNNFGARDRFDVSASLPSPFGLRLARAATGDELIDTVERKFSATILRTSASLLLAYTHQRGGGLADRESLQPGIELLRNSFAGTLIGSRATWGCELRTGCKLQHLNTDLSVERYAFAFLTEYSLVPHQASVAIAYQQAVGSSLKLTYLQVMPREVQYLKPFTKNDEAVSPSTSLDAQMRLQYGTRDATWFLQTGASSSGRRFASESIVLGGQIRHGKTSWSLSADTVPSRWTQSALSLQMLYEIDENLHRIVQRLRTRTLRLAVLSNALNMPVADAQIVVSAKNEIVATGTTNESGVFTSNALGCCGTFQIEARSGNAVKFYSLKVERETYSYEPKIVINDQYKIDVVFEVRSDAEESRPSDVTNYVPELGQAIISADGAKYFKNFIWVPLKHDFRFVVNAELLPYKYQIENVELPTSDDARMENTRIRVLLRKQ